MKLDKNTEVSLQRKKEKREKEFIPPVEKSSHLKQKPAANEGLISLFYKFIFILNIF